MSNDNVADVFFDVSKRSVQVDGNTVKDRYALVREDTGDVLSFVSPRYEPVSNKQVWGYFAEVAEQAGVKYEAGKGYNIRNGQKTIMEMVFPDLTIMVGKTDKMHLRGNLINGNDGMTAPRMESGFFRLVCSNGAVVGNRDTVAKYRHVKGVTGKIVSGFKDIIQNKLENVNLFVNQLADTKLKDRETIELLFADAKFFSVKNRQDLVEEWERQGKPTSAWEIYNVYTYVITHKMAVNQESKLLGFQQVNKLAYGWITP